MLKIQTAAEKRSGERRELPFCPQSWESWGIGPSEQSAGRGVSPPARAKPPRAWTYLRWCGSRAAGNRALNDPRPPEPVAITASVFSRRGPVLILGRNPAIPHNQSRPDTLPLGIFQAKILEAGPAPLFRLRNQSLSHRIGVHIVEPLPVLSGVPHKEKAHGEKNVPRLCRDRSPWRPCFRSIQTPAFRRPLCR